VQLCPHVGGAGVFSLNWQFPVPERALIGNLGALTYCVFFGHRDKHGCYGPDQIRPIKKAWTYTRTAPVVTLKNFVKQEAWFVHNATYMIGYTSVTRSTTLQTAFLVVSANCTTTTLKNPPHPGSII